MWVDNSCKMVARSASVERFHSLFDCCCCCGLSLVVLWSAAGSLISSLSSASLLFRVEEIDWRRLNNSKCGYVMAAADADQPG